MKTTRSVRTIRVGVIAAIVAVLASAATLVATEPRLLAQRGGGRPAPPATTAAQPPLGITLLPHPRGLEVQMVASGSLAGANGIRPGDVITHINTRPVPSAAVFSELVRNRAATQPLELRLLRNGASVTVQIPVTVANSGANRNDARLSRLNAVRDRRGGTTQTVASGEAADPFKIPGLAVRDTAAAGSNVLQRVFLDPGSGELVFLGRYDPGYATGAIDYTTLLHDALRSPSPSFSLEPTPASKAAVANFIRQFDQQMAANLRDTESGKAWLTGIFDQLLTNPSLETDRRRFLARGAEVLRVKPAEIPDYVQAMLGRTEPGSPRWVNFWTKFYERVGAPEAAEYIRAAANKENDPSAFQAALDGLGLRPAIDDLKNRMQSGTLSQPATYATLEVAVWEAIFSRCRIPESRWRAAANRARATGSVDAFRPVVDALNADLVRENVMDPWLNGLVFTENFLRVMNRMPVLETRADCREGLAADSELARTFLTADWTMKTLGDTPELAERVPGHLTLHQFAFQRESAAGVYDVGNVEMRFWLTPGTVALKSDSAGTVLQFGEARINVNAEVMSHQGGSRAAENLTRESTAAYAAEVTRRYEDYARVLPELHRLREAAKILALVHWAQARGVKLVPPGPPASAQPLPASFQRGFWTASFYAGADRYFFGLGASGGVDFGRKVGSDWVQTHEDRLLGGTALQQLAGSAALAQEAALAAENGDFESARSLADQSARAMTGDFDFTGHPALGKIPEVPPPTRVGQVELQTEVIAQSQRAVATLSRAQSAETRAESQQQLQTLRALLDQPAAEPAQTKHWVQLLRSGGWASLPQPAPHQLVAATPPPAPPAPAPVAPVHPAVDPAERARLRGEITQLRTELCRIQTQLRRFNATIQMDQGQRDEWEKRINDAYDNSIDRVKAALVEFSTGMPEDRLTEKLDTLTDPKERAKIKRALRLVQRLKEAYTLKDFSDWAAHDDYGKDEVIEGAGIIADILEVEDTVKDYLGKRWGLRRVFAYQEAASELITSAFDVTSEVVSWKQLNQLNRNSEAFLLATQKSGERIRRVIAGLHEREVKLGLEVGSTKFPCPE